MLLVNQTLVLKVKLATTFTLRLESPLEQAVNLRIFRSLARCLPKMRFGHVISELYLIR